MLLYQAQPAFAAWFGQQWADRSPATWNLSLNAVTHPITLGMQLTHLAPWPTEGTVRVIGLAVCLVSVATRRYLRATATWTSQAAAPQEKSSVTAGSSAS